MGGRVSSSALFFRVEELQVLEALFDEASQGHPQGGLLGGEAGIERLACSSNWPAAPASVAAES
jgi:hypothetical protein